MLVKISLENSYFINDINKFQNWNISKFMSVCPSMIAPEKSNSYVNGRVFMKRNFRSHVQEFYHLKQSKTTGNVQEDLCTYMIVYHSIIFKYESLLKNKLNSTNEKFNFPNIFLKILCDKINCKKF